MYLLKNAWLSITRNKGRNILIGIIFIAIAFTSTITLAIKNSANQIITSYVSKNDVEATLTLNRSHMMKDFQPGEENTEKNQEIFQQISSLTEEEIEKYGNSEYVDHYYYTYQFEMNSDSLEKASSEFTSVNDRKKPENEKNEDATLQRGDFTIKAYNSYDSMSEFIS